MTTEWRDAVSVLLLTDNRLYSPYSPNFLKAFPEKNGVTFARDLYINYQFCFHRTFPALCIVFSVCFKLFVREVQFFKLRYYIESEN